MMRDATNSEVAMTENSAAAMTDLPYPADLYSSDQVASSVSGGFEAVGEAEIAYFHEQGYLVIADAFDSEEIAAALTGMVHLMDGGCPEFRAIQFEPTLVKQKNELAGEARRDAIRKIFNFVGHEPRLNALASHPGLLGVLSQMMGDTPTLFQDMALVKPPHHGSEKPWHQDCAYFNAAPGTTVVGVWIALDRATVENGCLHIIPGSHREGPRVHFKRRDWQLCDTDVPVLRDTVVPLPPGGCLFWHGLTHHGSPVNRSGERRRALQFHYKPESSTEVTAQERLEMYGSEGKDVSC